MRERPQPASAPSELVTPLTASAASSAARARSISVSALGLVRIEHVERRPVLRDLAGVGEAANGSSGHRARHRDRALDQFVEHLRRAVARRHHRLLLADQHPQPEILALRAFELLGLAEPAGMRQRDALEHHRIGRIGAGPQRAPDQIVQQVDVVGGFLREILIGHDFSKSVHKKPVRPLQRCPAPTRASPPVPP